jgi:sec-independent protein translocase protein TatA
VLLLLIVLIIFGAKRLPEIGKGMGSGIREFRKGVGGDDSDSDAASDNRDA